MECCWWGSCRQEPHHSQPLLLVRARTQLGDELVHALPDLLGGERLRGVAADNGCRRLASASVRGDGCDRRAGRSDGEGLNLRGDAVVLVDLDLVDDVTAALGVDLPGPFLCGEELEQLAL